MLMLIMMCVVVFVMKFILMLMCMDMLVMKMIFMLMFGMTF